jgi:hypothetical protein
LAFYEIAFHRALGDSAPIAIRIGKNDAIFIGFPSYYSFDQRRNNGSGAVIGQADPSDCVSVGKRQFRHFLAKPIDIRPERIEKVKS